MALRTRREMRMSRGDFEGKVYEEIAKSTSSSTPANNTVTGDKIKSYQSAVQTGSAAATPISLTHGLGSIPSIIIPSIISTTPIVGCGITYTATSTVINVTPVENIKFMITAIK